METQGTNIFGLDCSRARNDPQRSKILNSAKLLILKTLNPGI